MELFTTTSAALQLQAKPTRPSRKSGGKGAEPFCAFCESYGHWAQDCQKITGSRQRMEKLRKSTLCFLCLKCGHIASNCGEKDRAQCIKCKRSHHRLICDEEEERKNTLATQTNLNSVGKIQVASRGFTYYYRPLKCGSQDQQD